MHNLIFFIGFFGVKIEVQLHSILSQSNDALFSNLYVSHIVNVCFFCLYRGGLKNGKKELTQVKLSEVETVCVTQ